MKFLNTIYLIIIAAAIYQNNIYSETKTNISKKNEIHKIILGTEDTNFYPVYGMYDSLNKRSNSMQGFCGELFNLYYSYQTKTEIRLIPIDKKNMFSEMFQKKFDIRFPDSPYWEKEEKTKKNIIYSKPVLNYKDGFFVLSSKKDQINMNNIKKIGIMYSTYPVPYVTDLIQNKKIKATISKNTEQLFKDLSAGKINGVYINYHVGSWALNKLKLTEKIVFHKLLPNEDSQYYISTLTKPEFIHSFNSFMENHKEEIKELKIKFNLEN